MAILDSQPNSINSQEFSLAPERQKLVNALRKVTLVDGTTKPYEHATIKIVTIPPDRLADYGAIALYALQQNLESYPSLDAKCKEEIGKPLNEVDGLYQLKDGAIITPPLVEILDSDEKVDFKNSNIVDGLHRFIKCIQDHKPLTIVEISGIKSEHQLPYKSFSPLDVVITDNVPDTKRIVSATDLDANEIMGRYRNLSIFGSSHRDKSYPLLPLIPWNVHQIERADHELVAWKNLSKSLEKYVPPLPSIVSCPPIRILIDHEHGQILNRSDSVYKIHSVFPINGPYSVGILSAYHYNRMDFYGRPSLAMSTAEILLTNREKWQDSCTKLITIFSPDQSIPYEIRPTTLKDQKMDNVALVTRKVKLPPENVNIRKESKFHFTKFVSSKGEKEIFLTSQDPLKEKKPNTVSNTLVLSSLDGDNTVLRLQNNYLFGVNGFGVDLSYPKTFFDTEETSTSTLLTGPSVLSGPDFLDIINLSFGSTSETYPNIFPKIVERIDQTQWYNPSFKWDANFFDAENVNRAIELENKINRKTKHSGQVSNKELIDLFKNGLIPDSKTITAISISLLRSQHLKLNSSYTQNQLLLEKKETPFGIIFVPPSLPVSEAKTANSMKFPGRKDRMDMSFTLAQTNFHKLEMRTSSGDLCHIKLSELIEVLTTSNDFLPFDIESLSHIFSSLIQVGALELILK
ncbi:hypothetical protein KKD37_02910 [Patescibacteria group bacterium]|nr:hypothetical protein [Patescibacteria group bacterium]